MSVEFDTKLKKTVLEAEAQGKVAVLQEDGSLAITPIENFIKQPIDRIEYDLNRAPETILSQWHPYGVNNYASMLIIKALHQKLDAIRSTEPEHGATDWPEGSYKFSQTSQERLASAHPVLQKLFNEVIRYVDCTIICGHREKAAQNLAVAGGHSKTRYPFSPHNKIPASAIDVMPYPIDWQDTERIAAFAGFVLGVAAMKGIDIKWGGDWNGNFNLKDQSFVDMPHYELILG
jgi:peptidoglycan LD-endopeptidase CwlK